jgi:hypothetical protein
MNILLHVYEPCHVIQHVCNHNTDTRFRDEIDHGMRLSLCVCMLQAGSPVHPIMFTWSVLSLRKESRIWPVAIDEHVREVDA